MELSSMLYIAYMRREINSRHHQRAKVLVNEHFKKKNHLLINITNLIIT